MYDYELVAEILTQIETAITTLIERFSSISSASDFTDSVEGIEKLDAICMLLIATGESLKKVDKMTEGKLLAKYPEIDWKGVKGMRDIISHHYFDIDADEIFWVGTHQLKPLLISIQKIAKNLHKKTSQDDK